MKPAPKKSTAVRKTGLSGYVPFLTAVKNRIRAAQVKASLAANAELIHLYWDIGRAIAAMQEKEGWGAGVIPRLARDIANDMPEIKGFSDRNIDRMVAFAREYPELRSIGPTALAQLESAPLGDVIVPQPVPLSADAAPTPISPTPLAKLDINNPLPIVQQLVAQLPWAHNVLLVQKVKDLHARLWYMRESVTQGWSHSVLALQINTRAHERHGKAVHNFHATLPPPQSDLAAQVIKDLLPTQSQRDDGKWPTVSTVGPRPPWYPKSRRDGRKPSAIQRLQPRHHPRALRIPTGFHPSAQGCERSPSARTELPWVPGHTSPEP